MSLLYSFFFGALSSDLFQMLDYRGVSTTSTLDARQFPSIGYQNGPGWSAAHVKRLSLKKRNQQRNKRAHRAKGKNHGIRQ